VFGAACDASSQTRLIAGNETGSIWSCLLGHARDATM
jgi:hypothetical protein